VPEYYYPQFGCEAQRLLKSGHMVRLLSSRRKAILQNNKKEQKGESDGIIVSKSTNCGIEYGTRVNGQGG
jgi:hypothetical protein